MAIRAPDGANKNYLYSYNQFSIAMHHISYTNVDPLRFEALFTASVILRRLMKMPMKLMKANSTKARKTIRKQNRMYLEFCGYVIMVGFTDTAMNGHKKGAKMMFLDGILRIM